ncbi:unnamed protein product, partial [Oikopleura dioica]
LDARGSMPPPTQAELRYYEEELKSAEAALDKQLEYLDDINSGSETVHDYFTYHTSPQNTSPPKASFIDIQTLPFYQLKEDLNRLDRCSSNDSGLGTSMSPTRAIEESSGNSDDASTPTPANSSAPVPQPRRRFPRLGVSAVLNSNAVSSDSSSDERLTVTPPPTAAPRTSTPSGSPSKLSETPQSPVISKQSESTLLPPDFLNPAIIPNSSASTQNIEDLLYPGMKAACQKSSSSGLAKKILSSLKSKTGSGLNRMRLSLAELTKSEKDKAMMESQIIQKIMSESENPTQPEDFSLHMIAEASLARLTEMTEQGSKTSNKQTPRAAVPPTGITIETGVTSAQKMVTPEPTRKSRRSKRVDPAEAARKSRHQSRRRKVISEVKKQVQSAHQIAPVPAPASYNFSPANAQQLKKVYKGQLPQYRNGQLDWNYLWFFSDSSTTNSSDKSHLNVTSPVTSITSSESESDSDDHKRPINRRRRVRAHKPSDSPAKEAKKRRIRRLAPPRDDNILLLGMI